MGEVESGSEHERTISFRNPSARNLGKRDFSFRRITSSERARSVSPSVVPGLLLRSYSRRSWSRF